MKSRDSLVDELDEDLELHNYIARLTCHLRPFFGDRGRLHDSSHDGHADMWGIDCKILGAAQLSLTVRDSFDPSICCLLSQRPRP